ncbi:hypothetical protein HID58_096231 [Brassica napus]|uniref:Uncharacterized protein n=1 Tax=Brassica napus TaxID=3708 RepID=A0ABQ7X2L8_BRANA|nr:hypothetical protein HID58_096231 [Brassica napus]
MIKSRDGSRRSSTSSYPADLLVCFPSRAHLALTPKSICSPSRPSISISTTNHHPHHRRQPSSNSPAAVEEDMGVLLYQSPPRKRGGKGKNWQTVMEEIERIHSNKSKSKFLGLLTCLKNIKFDFRCFGDFRHADVITSDDDEEDEDDDEEENTKNVFSKWFMVLQEEESKSDDDKTSRSASLMKTQTQTGGSTVDALLLMRCRSAPAKSLLEERMQVKTEQDTKEEEVGVKKIRRIEITNGGREDGVSVDEIDTDYYRLSSDIAKETWVVGGVQDPLSRSRSWKS